MAGYLSLEQAEDAARQQRKQSVCRYRLGVTRRNQQGRRELRKRERETEETLQSPLGGYQRPDRDDCHHKQYEVAYDDANSVRLQFNLWRSGGALVDFVVNVQQLTSDGWTSVEYFDCCHGHSHHHLRDESRDPVSIVRLDTENDVQLAFAQVNSIAWDRMRIIRDEGA
jgi:hypothetical protein